VAIVRMALGVMGSMFRSPMMVMFCGIEIESTD